MLPTLALVGRPNVGKSTLFNRLTASRSALVADFPGLTRDRQFGRARLGDRPYLVVDTGGFEPTAKTGIMRAMAAQTRTAIAEADAVIFMVDGRDGLTGDDRGIADLLRRSGRPVVLAVNKTEGIEPERASAEFHELALGMPVAISSAHGENVRALVEAALRLCPRLPTGEEASAVDDRRIRVAIVGRPNVGKSTLVNTLLGEERVIAFDEPGTTRDSLYLDFDRGGRAYTLIDTAGVRRRGKVTEAIEKFSVIKTLQAIEDAHVVVLMLDAEQGITEQDAHIAAHILEAGRAVVVAVNKWDVPDAGERATLKREIERTLGFLGFAEQVRISARDGKGIAALLSAIDRAYAAATARLPTPRLTRALQQALVRQQPPRAGLGRPKLRYAHQGGINPPVIVIHGNALSGVPDVYRRYLEHFFREAFQLQGTPLRIQFKAGANPYAESATRRRKRR
ncbi:MAG TPA: ribosome biogenesis GTPase Der [Casimicrobiaceae bacterium]|nr:ribosome biogenesis GTPase Der [Casimicrobiaceae bacterium]